MGHSEGLHRRSAGSMDWQRAAGMEMHAMAVEFPVVHGHPNRLPFEGVLTLVDVASDKAPSGSRGHRVVLTREAAETALPSLLGMAVDYKAGWDGHDARQKCGIITAAEIEGQRLTVAGYLFARDFPEMEAKIEGGQGKGADGDRGSHGNGGSIWPGTTMGMSYELADAHVADMRAQLRDQPELPLAGREELRMAETDRIDAPGEAARTGQGGLGLRLPLRRAQPAAAAGTDSSTSGRGLGSSAPEDRKPTENNS